MSAFLPLADGERGESKPLLLLLKSLSIHFLTLPIVRRCLDGEDREDREDRVDRVDMDDKARQTLQCLEVDGQGSKDKRPASCRNSCDRVLAKKKTRNNAIVSFREKRRVRLIRHKGHKVL